MLKFCTDVLRMSPSQPVNQRCSVVLFGSPDIRSFLGGAGDILSKVENQSDRASVGTKLVHPFGSTIIDVYQRSPFVHCQRTPKATASRLCGKLRLWKETRSSNGVTPRVQWDRRPDQRRPRRPALVLSALRALPPPQLVLARVRGCPPDCSFGPCPCMTDRSLERPQACTQRTRIHTQSRIAEYEERAAGGWTKAR